MKSFIVMLAILFISLVLVLAEDKIVRRSLLLTKSPKTNFPEVTKTPNSKTKSPKTKTTKSPTPTKAPADKSTKAPKKEKTASPKVTKAPKIITTKKPKVTKAPKIITTKNPKVTKAPKTTTTKNPKVTKAPKITTTKNPKATKVPKFDAKLPEIIPVPEKDNESPKTALDLTMLPTNPPNSVPSTTSITEVNTSHGEIVLASFSAAVTTVTAIFSWLF